MFYEIQYVPDGEMPKGHDFLLVTTPEGMVVAFRDGAVTPDVLKDAWAAYRAVLDVPDVPPPRTTPPERSLMRSLLRHAG